MGMLLRRHYATAEPVKPVEQPETVSVEEVPEEDIEQVAVTDVIADTEEEKVEEKPAKKPAVRRTVTKRKVGRTSTKRKE